MDPLSVLQPFTPGLPIEFTMPDWSYRTLFQPLLFLLPAETGRNLALGAMGRLNRLPFGPTIIDLFGHMRPDRRLRQTMLDLEIPGPVGIGCLVDPHGTATGALARFGVGFIEVGPIAIRTLPSTTPVALKPASHAITFATAPSADSIDDWTRRLSRGKHDAARRLARLTVAVGTSSELATDECRRMIRRLAPLVDGIVLATFDESLRSSWTSDDWQRHVQTVVEAARECHLNGRVWLAIRADLDAVVISGAVERGRAAGCNGVFIEGRVSDPAGIDLAGRETFTAVMENVRRLRSEFGPELSLVAGGVHEPVDAIELRSAGADRLMLDTGLIYSGPGLPKRINEAVLYADAQAPPLKPLSAIHGSADAAIPIQKTTWFWTATLGAAMLLGGLLAIGIATTRVIMPYDEVYVGMTREDLNLINPRLLAFMRHDRVTLSGTMFCVAVLYLFLSWHGIRRGHHWAMVAILVSAFVGFTSFFLFLGFGYFDPFHAFVTTVMLQFLLMAWQGELGPPEFTTRPNLRESPAWRWGQWGQLLFVIHGAVLVVAGAVISAVGCTSVFVREDLEFMDVCPTDLSLANPRLIPLIAHDRASFGGMLIASGVAVLLTALWGFREGARWQWWMLLLAGVPAYSAAIAVHIAVGYTSLWHLAPAYGGLALLIAGLALLWPYLGRQDSELAAEWARYSHSP